VISEFRCSQAVKAHLGTYRPISEYEIGCNEFRGFSNVSGTENNSERIAFDISPVNVLNLFKSIGIRL
jgi:hypothetical protein